MLYATIKSTLGYAAFLWIYCMSLQWINTWSHLMIHKVYNAYMEMVLPLYCFITYIYIYISIFVKIVNSTNYSIIWIILSHVNTPLLWLHPTLVPVRKVGGYLPSPNHLGFIPWWDRPEDGGEKFPPKSPMPWYTTDTPKAERRKI